MHRFLDLTQWEHSGRLSSHLILRCLPGHLGQRWTKPRQKGWDGGFAYLQFVQPVLTLGLLVRGLRGRCGTSLEPADGVGEVV